MIMAGGLEKWLWPCVAYLLKAISNEAARSSAESVAAAVRSAGPGS